MSSLRYRRVVVKLSGRAFAGASAFGLDDWGQLDNNLAGLRGRLYMRKHLHVDPRRVHVGDPGRANVPQQPVI